MVFIGYICTDPEEIEAGICLGNMDRMVPKWSSPSTPLPLPGFPPKDQEHYDMDGASLTVTIVGKVAFDTVHELLAWMEDMAQLHTGAQYDANEHHYLAIFDEDYPGYTNPLWVFRHDMSLAQDHVNNAPIHVFVEDFEPTLIAGVPTSCEYTVVVKQQVIY